MRAYDMRISDWGSDVCSSDLQECRGNRALGETSAQVVGDAISDDEGIHRRRHPKQAGLQHVAGKTGQPRQQRHRAENRGGAQQSGRPRWHCAHRPPPAARSAEHDMYIRIPRDRPSGECRPSSRSEEHTSELQSLMRTSYAVFCLKKKKRTSNTTYYLEANTQTNQ